MGSHVARLAGFDHVEQEIPRALVAARPVVLPRIVHAPDAGGGFLAGVPVEIPDRLLAGEVAEEFSIDALIEGG